MPPPAVRYTPRPYVRPRYEQGSTIGEILRLQGNQQAEAELRRGDLSAQMWGNLGNQISSGINAYAQQRAEAPRRAMQEESARLDLDAKRREAEEPARLSRQDGAFLALLEKQPQPDPREVIAIYGPQRGMAIAQGYRAFTELASGAVKDARETAGRLAIGAKASSPQLLAQFWPQIREAAVKGGLGKPEEIPEQATPEYLDAVIAWSTGKGPQADLMTVNPGDAVIDKNKPGAGAVFTAPAKPADAPTVGSFEDYVVRKFGQTPTPDQITQARKDYQQADDRPRVTIQTESGLTPTMEANIINRLTTQWGTVSAPAKELDRQIGLMDSGLAAARRGDLAQGSQAVLITFQKILDPTSVVLASEYARSAQGQALITRIQGAAERLAKGGTGVSLAELEKFAALAKEAAAVQRKLLPALQDRIGKTADRYKIPRELIFEGAALTADQSAPQAAPAAGAQVPNMTGVKPGFGRKFT